MVNKVADKVRRKDNLLSKHSSCRVGNVGVRHAKGTFALVGKVAVMDVKCIKGRIAHSDRKPGMIAREVVEVGALHVRGFSL